MSTALTLQPLGQDILDLENADYSFELNDAFLAVATPLAILGTFSPSLADFVTDFALNTNDLAGAISIVNGVFETELFFPDGSGLVGLFNVPSTLETYAALAATTDGIATLQGGILDARITAGDESVVVKGFNLAEAVEMGILSIVNSIEAEVPLVDGAFVLETDTVLGPFSGVIDIADGDLNVNLSTPFGQFSFDSDFGEDAVFPFVVPSPLGGLNAAVDLNAGNVVVSLGFLGDLAVPIDEIDGLVSLDDGIATFTAEVPGFGPVATELALGPLASEMVVEELYDLEGTVTIEDGILNAIFESDLGSLTTNFNVPAFTERGAEFFRGIDGLITLGDGIVTADIFTPLGDIDSSYNLTEIVGLLDVPLGEIIG
jgi:hypothetical protein